MGTLIISLISFVLGAAVFKFAISLLSPDNHLNTLGRAMGTSAIVAVITGTLTFFAGPLGALLAFIAGVVVIKIAYQIAVWRVLLVMLFNSILSALLGAMLGGVFR